MAAPYVTGRSPAPDESGAASDALISFDIVDADGNLDPTTFLVLVEGRTAYDGSSFVPPFTGPASAITATTVGSDDGYHLVIDSNELLTGVVSVSAEGEDLGGSPFSSKWSFLVGTQELSALYFSDGYGVKKINVAELAGESQDRVRTILSPSTSPSLPVDGVADISGGFAGGAFHLVVCPDAYGGAGHGAWVFKNETGSPKVFSDGYNILKARMNDEGTLYLANRERNRIEVYYGADIRDDYARPPDFVYDSYSSPPLLPGEITDMHLVPGDSLVCDGASRLYVGTSTGLTRIETCDLEDPDGYSSGQDGYGMAFTYTVAGQGGTYDVIGGAERRVASVHSDERFNTIMVATADGLTQIALSGNRRISFLTQDEGTLPSNDIREVFGRRPSET